MEWIFKRIRQDCNIEQQGIHFLNILDVKWDPNADVSPIGFYNEYRSVILGNLRKKDTKIAWLDDTLTQDEQLSPSHEDLIMLNVLEKMHSKLPAYIKDKYYDKITNMTSNNCDHVADDIYATENLCCDCDLCRRPITPVFRDCRHVDVVRCEWRQVLRVKIVFMTLTLVKSTSLSSKL